MTDWVVDLANHVRSNFPDWAQNVFAYQLPEGAPDPSIVIAPVIEGIPYDVEYPDRYRGPYRAIVTTKDIALAHNLGEEVLRMLTIFGTQMGGTEIIRSFPTNTPVVYPKAASDLYEVMVMLEVILIDRRIRTGADLVGTGLLTMGSFSLNGQSVTSISGNVNITMGNFTLTAEDLASTGSGDSTLDDFTLNGVSKLAITAALNEGMDSFSMSATGAHGSFPGSLISSLNSFSMNAAGTTLIEMSGGYTLDDFTISGGGLPGITAVAAVSLDDFTVASVASTFFPANGLVIMDDFSASGAGVITISGSAGVTLDDFTLATATNLPISATLNQNFPALTLAGVSSMTIEGDLSSVMGDFTLSALGGDVKVGDLSSTLDDFTLTGTANTAISGFVVFDFDPFTLSGSAGSEVSGSAITAMGDFSLSGIGILKLTGDATSIPMDDFVVSGAADPSLIDASAVVTMGEFSISSAGSPETSGAATFMMNVFTMNGSASSPIDASASMAMGDFTVTSSDSHSSIDSSATIAMDSFTVSGLSNLAIPGSSVSTLSEFAVVATAETSIPATATMVMADATIVSAGETEVSASALLSMGDFSVTAAGNSGSVPTITIEETVNTVADGNPMTFTPATTPDAGNLLVVVAGNRASVGDNSITGYGDNWTQHFIEDTYQADNFWRRMLTVWTKIADGTESGSISVDFGDGDTEAVYQEIAISDGLLPVFEGVEIDVGVQADETSWSMTHTGLSAHDRLIMGVFSLRGDDPDPTTFTWSSLQNDAFLQSAGTDHFVGIASKIDQAGGTISETFTIDNGVGGAAALLTFRLYGIPTLDANVQMAWDPVGSSANTFGIGSHPDVAANYSLWPINGTSDTVDPGWNGAMDGTGANHLVIDNTDLVDAGVSDGVAEYSVSFWYKRNDTPNDYRTFFGQGSNWPSFGGNVGDYGLRAETVNLFQGARGTSWGSAGDTGADPFDGTWHHITMTIADQAIRVYVDGVLERSSTGSNFPLSANASAMVWGYSAMAGRADHTADFRSEQTMDHEVGDIRIYNKELNSTEIAALHTGGRAEYAGQAAAPAANEPETDALIAQMTVAPDATRESHINTLVKAMKDAGAWSKLAWFSIIGHDDDASLKNWIVPTEDLQQLNNAVIVPDQYFDSKSNPSGNGCFRAGLADDGGAALANMTFGCYFVKLDESGSTRASRISDNNTFFRCDFGPPTLRTTGGSSHPNTYATYVINADYHMTMVHRGTGAADREAYYNGVSYDTKDGSGGSLSLTADVDLMGTAVKDSDERYFCGYYGTALTSQEVSDLHDAIEVYKTAIGA